MEIKVDGVTVEIDDDVLDMFHSMTPLQQNVAINKLSGMTNRDSYTRGGGTAKSTSSVDVCASGLLSNPKVKSFIQRARTLRFSQHIMTKDEMGARLTDLARTEVRDIVDFVDAPETEQTMWRIKPDGEMGGAGHAAISEIVAGRDGIKFKIHDQRAAMKQLAQLYGYEQPQRIEVEQVKSLDDLYDSFESDNDNEAET